MNFNERSVVRLQWPEGRAFIFLLDRVKMGSNSELTNICYLGY